MKVEIKNRYDETVVIFTAEVENGETLPLIDRLRKAILQAVEAGTNLRDANLRGANLSGATLSGANLSGASLRDANLRGATLSGTDLRDATLSGTDLRDANLRDANLSGASLRDANLRGATLSGTDLRDATLSGANLSYANLRDAKLGEINLRRFKSCLWMTLTRNPSEVRGLVAALKEGRVNGSVYEGECACLVGTIANVRGVNFTAIADHNSSYASEQWFLMISKGDTPDKDTGGGYAAKLALDWVEEWQIASSQNARSEKSGSPEIVIIDDSGKKRIYIAGPMRGYELYNFPAFDTAEEILTDQGYDVVNPANFDRDAGNEPTNLPADHDWTKAPEGFDLGETAISDVSAIVNCDAIYMLDGWHDSRGAKAEKAVAEWLGKEVLYETVEEDVLEEALRITSGDRQASYGPPDQDFKRTADLVNALFADYLRDGKSFKPVDVASLMVLLKLSRQRHQGKRDNWVDIAGYARCGQICDEAANDRAKRRYGFRDFCKKYFPENVPQATASVVAMEPGETISPSKVEND